MDDTRDLKNQKPSPEVMRVMYSDEIASRLDELQTANEKTERTTELLTRELIDEIKNLKREIAGYTFLFAVSGEDVESFEKDLETGQKDSLQLKFSKQNVVLSERVAITKERDVWKLTDLRTVFHIIKEKGELLVYGKEKTIPLDYELKYESGIQTITTATTQPDTIGTYPPDENYPNKELIRERSRSEIYPLGRNAPYLWVKNEGPGNLYILSTTNGVEWGYAESKLAESEVDVFHNVYALALRTDIADTSYRATEYKLVTGAMSIIRGERVRLVKTDSTQHFTGAITMNNQETENITGLKSNKIYIRGVNIQSVQPLEYRLIFWSKGTFDDTDIDADTYFDDVELDMRIVAGGAAFRISTANQYYLNVAGLGIVYEDEDGTYEIHMSLQNESAVAKIAGTLGAVQIDVFYTDRL